LKSQVDLHKLAKTDLEHVTLNRRKKIRKNKLFAKIDRVNHSFETSSYARFNAVKRVETGWSNWLSKFKTTLLNIPRKLVKNLLI